MQREVRLHPSKKKCFIEKIRVREKEEEENKCVCVCVIVGQPFNQFYNMLSGPQIEHKN